MNTYTIPFRETEDDIIDVVLKKLNLHPTDIFIDIGSGNGIVIEKVKQMYAEVKCIGMEIDPGYCSRAYARLKKYNYYEIIQTDLRTFNWSIFSYPKTHYYVAWTKTYIKEFDFSKLPSGIIISYKHLIPNMTYYDIIKSDNEYNNVYFYTI